MTPPSRCTGHCCRRFPLSATLAHVHELAADPGQHEARQLVDMLIPLGTAPDRAGKDREYFTCRHHDAVTGDCGIYADRPRMCRDYPYGNACEHSECTAQFVPIRLKRWSVGTRDKDVLAERAAEVAKPTYAPRAPDHRPGARNPGHKSKPATPKWARERRGDRTERPGR
jgi:Fe-S-cluster containining protein